MYIVSLHEVQRVQLKLHCSCTRYVAVRYKVHAEVNCDDIEVDEYSKAFSLALCNLVNESCVDISEVTLNLKVYVTAVYRLHVVTDDNRTRYF